MKKRFFAAAFAAMLLLSGCGTDTKEPVSKSAFVLNTIASISIYEYSGKKDASGLIDEAFALCSEYENLLSRTIEGSDVCRLNESKGETVLVAPETEYLIRQAVYFSELSDGAFDITIAPASVLWDFNSESPLVPGKDALDEAVALIGYENISFGEDGITLRNGAKIDLGGIAKGYITDRLVDYLKENGVKSAIVNLGGNIYAAGRRDSRDFNIGIKKPFGENSKLAGILHVSDTSVVTSGVYERYFERDGIKYHHILDPETGMPVYNGIDSVTIICPSSLYADALSTAAFVLGAEKGLRLIESMENTEAVFIMSDGSYIESSGIGSAVSFDKQ